MVSVSPLTEQVRARCRDSGPLPLSQVMAEAVQAYYAGGRAFGADGDFTTAPEISQTYGELLGLWSVVVWQMMGCPSPVRWVEVGPGRGTLIRDALRAAAAVPAFLAAVDLHLVETSPALRDQQRQAVGERPCQWHDTLAMVPAGPMILLANEFLDALPIEQWVRSPLGWHARCVEWVESRQELAFTLAPALSAADEAALCDRWGEPFLSAPDGAIVELCPLGVEIAAALGQRLAEQGGAALLVDYGYAVSQSGDSLQALRHHRFHPALADLGLVDLTAHVDFARLASAAVAQGAQALGPVTQGRFLAGLGIEARAKALMKRATPQQASDIASGVHRLINPAEMGTLFKVITLCHPALPSPPGFEALLQGRSAP